MIEKVEEFGKNFLPDVPDWSDNAPDPWRSMVISKPRTLEPPAKDN
jgi:hypothetical protein